MKVVCYCQHVLGIGHLQRSLAICRALALRHPTSLILGGPATSVDTGSLPLLQLPGLRMDEEFSGLIPCEEGRSLEEVKAARQAMLLDYFRRERPDLLLTELYPFGRKAFRFELAPLLDGISDGSLPRCLCCCSVRDILVEKVEGREKFEGWTTATLNSRFAGVLVHADPRVVTLDETFGRLAEINIPLHYTGYVTGDVSGDGGDESGSDGSRQRLRQQLALAPAEQLIVASIGGGTVGHALLTAACQAFPLIRQRHPARLQIFTGPYCPESELTELARLTTPGITVERYTGHFADWLAAADLSLSMAGYNTVMNLLQAGVPALVYPFTQNREQAMRIERLAAKSALLALGEGDLAPERLAGLMLAQLRRERYRPAVDLDGAAESCRQLERWYEAWQ